MLSFDQSVGLLNEWARMLKEGITAQFKRMSSTFAWNS